MTGEQMSWFKLVYWQSCNFAINVMMIMITIAIVTPTTTTILMIIDIHITHTKPHVFTHAIIVDICLASGMGIQQTLSVPYDRINQRD